MFREKLKVLLRQCRRLLSRLLPLTVGEWLCLGSFSALFLALVFLLLVQRTAPAQALESYWRLKLAGIGGLNFLDQEYRLPDGRVLRASVLTGDPRAAQSAAGALPCLEQAERTVGLLFPFLTLFIGWLWSSSKGHMAGAGELIRGRQLIGEKELTSGLKEEGLLPFGPVLLPRKYEGRHVLVAGDRAGRTAVLTRQLEAIRRAGLPAVVHDPAGEFAAKFYRPGVDHIANPFDGRGVSWNLFDDLESLTELSGLAESVIPFATSAQDLLRGTVAALHLQGRRTHAGLWEALGSSVGNLARLCASVEQGEAGCRVLEAPPGREAEQALALLRSRLSWLEFARGEGGFSVKKWLADPGGSFVFLTSHPEVEQTLRPYRSLLVELFGRWSLTLPRRPEGRLFFVLDELAELQTLPGIRRLMAGGKEGAAVILGVRDLASLECRYRDTDVQAILNGCGSLLVLRLPDGRSADYFSWRFGDTQYWDERDLRPKGEAPGAVPWTLAPRTDRLLIGSQFLELKELAGYLLLPRSQPSLVTLAPRQADRLPAPAPPFVLRAGYALEDLKGSEERRGEREVRLGIPHPPERSAAAGEGAAPGRPLNVRLEF